ncbi:MAG: DUF362 domain-containing protein [Desulfobacula sp.]|nr:DUF362 domain-containing protein [Desulfobacula sp.]
MKRKITRRQFLTYSAGAIAGISFGEVLPINAASKDSDANSSVKRTKVCIIRSLEAWNGFSANKDVVRKMLDHGVKVLSGSDDVSKAWKEFFQRRDIVALKVNPIARRSGSTKPEVCYALAESIRDNVGVPLDQTIVFDVSRDDLVGAGYCLNQKKGTVQVYQSDTYSEFISVGGVKAKISRIITEECTALVNIPLLKTHKSSGISIALKNHYGSIPKDVVRDDAYRYHMDRFKNLTYLNLMPPIYDKTRLIVVDGLVSQYNRGPHGDPRYQWKFNGIIMGTDPVAVDSVCLNIINDKRMENSLDPLVLPYLDWARQEGLGTNLLERIEVYDRLV